MKLEKAYHYPVIIISIDSNNISEYLLYSKRQGLFPLFNKNLLSAYVLGPRNKSINKTGSSYAPGVSSLITEV